MKLPYRLLGVTVALTLIGCTGRAPDQPAPVEAPPAPPPLQAAAPEQPPAPVWTGPWVKVTDQSTGAPVEHALVWVEGDQNMGRTDAQGRAQLFVPLAPGERALVVSPADRAAYKASRYLITVAAGAPEEYNLVVSSDRLLTFDHGREVPTPAFNPAPQRVSAETIKRCENCRQVHALRYARSAWLDGEGQSEGFWEPFVVSTGSTEDRPAIRTYLLNGGGPWDAVYDCPRAIGALTITGIDETGMLVSFTSTSGVTGRFHLVTHEWQFD